MDFSEVINKRTSVRKYKAQQPAKEQLEAIIEAARQAPSACNRQPWKFYVIQSAEILEKVRQAYDREWFRTSPTVIVVAGNHDESWYRQADGKDHCDIDVAIAAEHIALAATNEGLSSCWICNFDKPLLAKILNIEGNKEPIVMFAIGFADETAKPHTRKELSEVVEYM